MIATPDVDVMMGRWEEARVKRVDVDRGDSSLPQNGLALYLAAAWGLKDRDEKEHCKAKAT